MWNWMNFVPSFFWTFWPIIANMLGVAEKSFHLLDKLSVQLFLCAGLEFGTFAGQNLRGKIQ